MITSVFGTGRAAFRRPSLGANRVSDCPRSGVARRGAAWCGAAPASAVNELTLTNAPFGIVRGKTGGLAPRRASAPPPAPPGPRANRGPSRHSLPAFWREALAASASATCRVRVVARFQRDLSTRHLLRIEIENSRLALSLSRPAISVQCIFREAHARIATLL